MRLASRLERLSALISFFFATWSIQSRSAEMKISAGAAASICLASAELAA
jgi:hypothetical protein